MLLFLHSVFPLYLSNSYLSLKSQLYISLPLDASSFFSTTCWQVFPPLCCHSSLNMLLSCYLSHCSYVFPCLFLTIVWELVDREYIYLFQLCLFSSHSKGLVQSVPKEVWLICWSADQMVHSPTHSGSGREDGTVNSITFLPCQSY